MAAVWSPEPQGRTVGEGARREARGGLAYATAVAMAAGSDQVEDSRASSTSRSIAGPLWDVPAQEAVLRTGRMGQHRCGCSLVCVRACVRHGNRGASPRPLSQLQSLSLSLSLSPSLSMLLPLPLPSSVVCVCGFSSAATLTMKFKLGARGRGGRREPLGGSGSPAQVPSSTLSGCF